LILFLLGLGCVAPFRTNGVFLDNRELIEKLTRIAQDIEETVDGIEAEI